MIISSTKAEMMVAPLRDGDVRAAAMIRLLAHARRCADTLVIDELGLARGAARVDIAVINGHIRGVEIKAEADKLERLPRQMEAYGRVVDKATLIAAQRHLPRAEKMAPEWWGLIEAARAKNGSVIFRRVRAERVNHDVEPVILARRLWRTEAAAALATMGCEAKLLRAPRAVLYQELVDRLPRPQLGALCVRPSRPVVTGEIGHDFRDVVIGADPSLGGERAG